MADNVVANAGSGGATFRAFSDGTNEWPAAVVSWVTGGSAGAWTVQQADGTHGLPVNVGYVAGTAADTNSGNKSAGTLRVVLATDQPQLTNALKVDGSAVTQPVSGTVTANLGTSSSDRNATGSLTATGTVTMSTNGCGSAVITLTGTGAGLTWSIQGQDVGGNWFNIPAVTPAGVPVAPGNQSATSGQWIVPVAGWNNLRVNLTAISSGTATFSLEGSMGCQAVSLANALPAGSNTIGALSANQSVNLAQVAGSATATGHGTAAGAVRVELPTDGTGLVSAAQSGSWTVTANAGTNLNTSALALESGGNLATVAGAVIAQEATTSGVKGVTAFGAVTTNAPSYTTAKSDALSLDTSGLLRVSVKDTPANTNNLNVNLAASAATVTVSATNLSTNVAQFGGSAVVTGTGAGGSGIPRVTVSNDSETQLWDGSNGPVAVDNNASSKALAVCLKPTTSGGPTLSRVKSAASTNATNLKASAGMVYGWALFNNTGTAKYFKWFNKASSPTVGTDTPAFTVLIPANGGTNVEFSQGIPFGTGIGYGITGAIGDSDTTNTAADDVHGVVLTK